MFEADFGSFIEMLDAVYSLHGKTIPAGAKALFFRALSAYPLPVVRAAIDAHVKDAQRGQFPPKPADIIAQIEGLSANDSRPGPEEAWAIAVQAFDESATVVMNDEIAEAQGIARPIFELGDEVGARMAFREAYGRLVAQARADGKVVCWWPSLGSDVDRRHYAIEKAVTQWLLPDHTPELCGALPAPTDATPLLESMIERPDAHGVLNNLKKLLDRDNDAIEAERLERVQVALDATRARKAELQRQAESIEHRDAA